MPKVLVANRGEIAIRVLRAARELGWSTVAVYTAGDASHAGYADEAIQLAEPSQFMDAQRIADVASSANCTHVHPGYGFLSESAALAVNLASLRPPCIFIGPSTEALQLAGDKLLSRELAVSLGINVAPGQRVHSVRDVVDFASVKGVGYPVMIKALDGGGGRGIRVVRTAEEVEESFKRCLGESPSRQIFAEKALTGPGWKHIEVQIIGDGSGSVNHFWERECSVQRRFQKVVEVAPSRLSRAAVQPLIDASLKVATHLKYHGLGTFEYLVNAESQQWVFLEINPRVQVEHTITDEVNDIDLVRAQLQLFDRKTLQSLSLDKPFPVPSSCAIQLRITAENPLRDFQLSPGSILSSDVTWPGGRGVRIDTWLTTAPSAAAEPWTVGTDFDSLLAKLIVCGRTFEEMNQKAQRALSEFSLTGKVQTNAAVLAGVIAHPDWLAGEIDTLWLERNIQKIIEAGATLVPKARSAPQAASIVSAPSSTAFLQPGALFHLDLTPAGEKGAGPKTKHTLTLSSIGQNAFPEALSGTLQTSLTPTPFSFFLSQSTSAAISSADFELADPNDARHVGTPMTGKIVELHPALLALSKGGVGGEVKKGETLMVMSVMKMENAITAPRDGLVVKVGKGVKPGIVVGEGVLICVVDDGNANTSKL